MGQRLILLGFIVFIFLERVNAKGNINIFTDDKRLLLHRRKCQTCILLPIELHELYDPFNSTLVIGGRWLNMIYRNCGKNTDTPEKQKNTLRVFLRKASKWCGNQGDKAVHQCCHERSSCPLKLKRKQVKDNVKNEHPFTINDCDCELKFAKCLKKVGNNEAQQLLRYIFEVFPSACLTYDHPFTCDSQKKNNKRCTKNTKKPKKWQIRNLSNLQI